MCVRVCVCQPPSVLLYCLLQVAPGVKVGLVANLPDTQSGKLLVDFVNKKVHVKSSVGLTTQPKVSLSAATGYKNLVFGAEAAYDTAKSVVSNYGLAVGVHAGDSQLAVHLQVGFGGGHRCGHTHVCLWVYCVCSVRVCVCVCKGRENGSGGTSLPKGAAVGSQEQEVCRAYVRHLLALQRRCTAVCVS